MDTVHPTTERDQAVGAALPGARRRAAEPRDGISLQLPVRVARSQTPDTLPEDRGRSLTNRKSARSPVSYGVHALPKEHGFRSSLATMGMRARTTAVI